MKNIIETNNLTKYYSKGKVLGIKNVNLKIKEGEIFGFIGPNGAGKSTTIRLLLDLIRPTSGSATIFGLDINKKTNEIKQDIGYLPGDIFFPENMTGIECINYYRNFKKKVSKKYLDLLISKLDLDIKKKTGTYSKGNKQKLAIILAMMHQPKLLILDEPTTSLDPLNQQAFYDLLNELKDNGTTVFFSTHILSEADKICQRIGIIKEGLLQEVRNIDDFRQTNIRKIIVETNDKLPLKMLKIKDYEKTKTGYKFKISGKNGEVLKELSKYSIEDIKIEEPTLEEIFMHYYE
jgi:ABC-2 type transport system ATP-binding protein